MADPADGPRTEQTTTLRGFAARRGKQQGRRSRLIIRRVDPWTVLKFSALLYLSTYFVFLVAGIVLWSIADATGVRGNIESFVSELIASEEFTFEAGQILRASVFGGALLVLVGTFANVLMAVLFNLISDVVGGIGIAVEERPPRRRGSKGRRKAAAKAPARHRPDNAANNDGNSSAARKPRLPAFAKKDRAP